jgi:hypothetical protein
MCYSFSMSQNGRTAGWLAMLFSLLTGLTVSCGRTNSAPGNAVVTISNVEPRRDTTGEIIDAHDGCLQFFNGRFYLYGTAYGTNDGYGDANRYRVYSSPDLGQWQYEGELLHGQPKGVYYRPYVVFNARTRKYVLWYNWYAKLWHGQEGVAISDTPVGPFTIVNTNLSLAHADPGDGSLFVDDDGTGYYIYSTLNDGGTVRVERLTPDYLATTGETSGLLAIGTESPVLFRRNNLYYALCGPRCNACAEGSEAQVLVSRAPLGPYISRPESNINHQLADAGSLTATQQIWTVTLSSANTNGILPDGSEKKIPMIIRTKNRPLIPAQETWVAKIPTPGGPVFIWMADRWGSAPDGVKGHDLQYWSLPLEFDPNGDIRPLANVAQWQISRATEN